MQFVEDDLRCPSRAWIDVKIEMDFWINQNHYPELFILKGTNLSQISIKNYTSLYKNLNVYVTGTTQTQLEFNMHECYTRLIVRDGRRSDKHLYSKNGWVIINLQQIGK